MTWNEAALETLLLLLDRDRDRAGKRYEDIFARLTRFLHGNFDAAEAEDIAAETMLRLPAAIYRRLTGTIESPGVTFEIPRALEDESVYRAESESVMRHAFKIAKSLRVERYRLYRREIDEEAGAEEGSHHPIMDAFDLAEQRERLTRAIQGLSPEERRIITARFLEDRSMVEIAAQLGMTTGSIYRRHYKALRKLRDILSGDVARATVSPVPRAGEPNDVRFTAYWPAELVPRDWYTVEVYAHLPGALDKVRGQAKKRLGEDARGYADAGASSGQTIARGAEIVIAPELAGCRFNPPSARFHWLEDCHSAEFRLQAHPDIAGFQLGSVMGGRISFYVGPVLVAEIRIEARIVEHRAAVEEESETHFTSEPYKAIFVSYSHLDTVIAEQLEEAYKVLGMEYLRDVHTLRAGELWNPALLKRIEQADIFQLLWSNAAKRSVNVRKEWKHALGQHRPFFIRPVYWEVPMPRPPRDLREIQFAYLQIRRLSPGTDQ
jgi:RNA polymerase sigma factor (sigma-70 family)